jgi:hypothetical protein
LEIEGASRRAATRMHVGTRIKLAAGAERVRTWIALARRCWRDAFRRSRSPCEPSDRGERRPKIARAAHAHLVPQDAAARRLLDRKHATDAVQHDTVLNALADRADSRPRWRRRRTSGGRRVQMGPPATATGRACATPQRGRQATASRSTREAGVQRCPGSRPSPCAPRGRE